MMWHWNSLWARAPGDPPTIADPVLWQSPWSAEALALQASTWEAMLSASHSWWTTMLAAWPASPWAMPTWPLPQADSTAARPAAEPLTARLPAPAEPEGAALRKRRPAARKSSARKR
jgi:hypothetical protein